MSATLMGHGELVAYVVSQGRGGAGGEEEEGNGRKAGRVGMEIGGGAAGISVNNLNAAHHLPNEPCN